MKAYLGNYTRGCLDVQNVVYEGVKDSIGSLTQEAFNNIVTDFNTDAIRSTDIPTDGIDIAKIVYALELILNANNGVVSYMDLNSYLKRYVFFDIVGQDVTDANIVIAKINKFYS